MVDQTNVADILDRAADLIEPKGAWTQGAWARDAKGHPTTLWGNDAVCFCMRGALVRVSKRSMMSEMSDLQDALGFRTAAKLARWNDSHTQSEVVTKLREASSALRARSTPGPSQ